MCKAHKRRHSHSKKHTRKQKRSKRGGMRGIDLTPRRSTKPTISSPLAISAKIEKMKKDFRYAEEHVERVEEKVRMILKRQGMMLAPASAADLVDYTRPQFRDEIMMAPKAVQQEYKAAVAELAGARSHLRDLVAKVLA